MKFLLTLVERKTRNTLVRKIPGKTAEAVMAEMERLKEDFGGGFSRVFKTITSDNGSEFSALAALDGSDTKITSPIRILLLRGAPMSVTMDYCDDSSPKERGYPIIAMTPLAGWKSGSMAYLERSSVTRRRKNSLMLS